VFNPLGLLSFLILPLLLNSCSSFVGPGELASTGSTSAADVQPYDLLLPEFQGPYLRPGPRNGGGPFFSETFLLDWPVNSAKLTQKFRPPSNLSHQGIDLSGSMNTPILAAHNGIVVYAGSGFKGYGKLIIVEFSDEWATLYGHLNRFQVKTGDWVAKGQTIGKMGRTGRVSGVHLHFELIHRKQPIDPLSLLRWQGEVAAQFSDQGLLANSY
jgi:murein DD-endopeptidase MepM/ murein hydrolase activator NlpD